jgi:hypothetical protein
MATARQKNKVEKVMHEQKEQKEGKLRTSAGKKVNGRRQAIAIAMSESGQSRKKKRAR